MKNVNFPSLFLWKLFGSFLTNSKSRHLFFKNMNQNWMDILAGCQPMSGDERFVAISEKKVILCSSISFKLRCRKLWYFIVFFIWYIQKMFLEQWHLVQQLRKLGPHHGKFSFIDAKENNFRESSGVCCDSQRSWTEQGIVMVKWFFTKCNFWELAS